MREGSAPCRGAVPQAHLCSPIFPWPVTQFGNDQIQGKERWMDQFFVGEEWDVHISTQQLNIILASFIQRSLWPKLQIFESLYASQIIQMLGTASQSAQEGCAGTWLEE